jgi:ferric-dicitrate binding protein FerR (iron transport regulator)
VPEALRQKKMPDHDHHSCDPDALHRLLSALVDGDLSSADLTRLDAMLFESPAARAEYREFMCVESLLTWTIASSENCLADPRPAPQPRRFRAAAWLAVAAVTLVVGVAALAWIPLIPRPARDVMLTAEDAAVWLDGRHRPVGRAVGVGPLRLESGNAQITFPSGAVVAMQPGAEVEILGPNRLFLKVGQVTPFVPPAAKGFTVVSPSGEVIDFGTEFSVHVGRDGQTDVFVIGGEVDVTGGQSGRDTPLRMTQGFATTFNPADKGPLLTQQPLLIDHFEAAGGPLTLTAIDPRQASRVADGWLRIPIDRGSATTQAVIAGDFATLLGRKSTISFKAMLPGNGRVAHGRWLALVIDDGSGGPPMAFDSRAQAAVMMSPMWQAGLRVEGEPIINGEIFPRSQGIEGPYQVVFQIDDTQAAHQAHGSAVVTLMINGLEFVRQQPIQLGTRPRLAFQTYVTQPVNADGEALIDDFSISTDVR